MQLQFAEFMTNVFLHLAAWLTDLSSGVKSGRESVQRELLAGDSLAFA